MAENTYVPHTWGDVTRTTEPMWRSVQVPPPVYSNIHITSTSNISGGTFYFINGSGLNLYWDDPSVDPNMQLPPGF